MKGLLYLPEVGGVADQLKELVEGRIPEENLEVYRSLESLSQRFRQPFDDLGVAVLMTGNYEELKNISSIRDLLRDLQIILVIPDQKEETVALAHQLRPRLLTYIDGDLSMITNVLGKMLNTT
ncbi:MAG: hypothetical protein FJ106_00985 [Deltaproteobacteria bacterium]|nr:hypothetical protein [Deltaproteobacteria bacterium]